MTAGRAVPRRVKKAGLSGLLLCSVLAWAAANAEPLAIEIVDAELGYDQRTGEPVVSFKMSPTSARQFAELTAKNIGRKMAIRVDGQTISAPVIREPILGGFGQIADRAFTIEQARQIADGIRAGRAKVEFEIVNDQ